MFRRHARSGVSFVAVQVALLGSAGDLHAQRAEQVLPPVTIDAPKAQAKRAARKPAQAA
jgi:iron complex outermembrane receptor protein